MNILSLFLVIFLLLETITKRNRKDLKQTMIKFNLKRDWDIINQVSKMDIIISKEEIKGYERLKIISELTLIKQRVKLLERKYESTFSDFEALLNQDSKEDFAKWDDYIEWKAYNKKQALLKEKLDKVDHAQDIKITENP